MTGQAAGRAPTAASPDVLPVLARGIDAASALGLDTASAAAMAAAAEAGEDNPAGVAAALAALGAEAGIEGRVRDLVTERLRRNAVDGSVSELAALLDMDGLELGALDATRARAASLLVGPLGMVARVLARWSRRPPAAPTPGEHVREWRARGDLAPVADRLAAAVRASFETIPPALRPAYQAAADPVELRARLSTALDRLIVREEPETARAPSSLQSRFFVLLLWLDSVVLALATAATGAFVFLGMPVPTQKVVFLGPVPAPLLVVGLALGAWLLLAAGYRRHVTGLGRRWARRLEVVFRIGARNVVEGHAYTRVDRLESSRLTLATAVHDAAAWAATEQR